MSYQFHNMIHLIVQMFDGAVTITKEDSNIVIEVIKLHFHALGSVHGKSCCTCTCIYWQFSPSHLQWSADSVNDMYADAVLVMVLQIESNPHGLQSESHDFYTIVT